MWLLSSLYRLQHQVGCGQGFVWTRNVLYVPIAFMTGHDLYTDTQSKHGSHIAGYTLQSKNYILGNKLSSELCEAEKRLSGN